jgi:hypothetical protein
MDVLRAAVSFSQSLALVDLANKYRYGDGVELLPGVRRAGRSWCRSQRRAGQLVRRGAPGLYASRMPPAGT